MCSAKENENFSRISFYQHQSNKLDHSAIIWQHHPSSSLMNPDVVTRIQLRPRIFFVVPGQNPDDYPEFQQKKTWKRGHMWHNTCIPSEKPFSVLIGRVKIYNWLLERQTLLRADERCLFSFTIERWGHRKQETLLRMQMMLVKTTLRSQNEGVKRSNVNLSFCSFNE